MPALRHPSTKKGFTLIELMIAISIVAIIAAVGITSFSQSQKLARDARRKQDLRSIAVALELYYQKYGHFPCVVGTGGGWLKSGTTVSNWITNDSGTCATGTSLDSTFINSMPIDPSKQSHAGQPQSDATSLGYGYFSAAWNPTTSPANACNKAAGQSYILVAGLENASDPEAFANKSYKQCDGVTTLTTGTASDFGANKFIITSW